MKDRPTNRLTNRRTDSIIYFLNSEPSQSISLYVVKENWESWEPDPVDADPSKVSRGRRSADIISMLVNIYGSKKIFVTEYKSLLSNRLLMNWTFETDKEIR